MTGGFPSQRASNTEKVFIWWCHHGLVKTWCSLVMLYCDINGGQHWFRWLLFTCSSMRTHYPIQCWIIVNWTLKNNTQCNLHQHKQFSYKNMHLIISFAKCCTFCLSLSVFKSVWPLRSLFWSSDNLSETNPIEANYQLNLVLALVLLSMLVLLNILRLRQNGPTFCRQHLQMHFLGWKCMNFEWNFTEVCSLGSN